MQLPSVGGFPKSGNGREPVEAVMCAYIVAEVGPNHNGSLELAIEMVGALARAGADAVKFQIALPERIYSTDAFKAAYQIASDGDGPVAELSRRVQLGRDDHRRLHDECRKRGVAYMCTAFDVDSLDPAFAPGTGTPEIGGLSSLEAIEILRGLAGLPMVGGDVVEVAPQYDAGSNTAHAAAQILFTIFCLARLAEPARKAVGW